MVYFGRFKKNVFIVSFFYSTLYLILRNINCTIKCCNSKIYQNEQKNKPRCLNLLRLPTIVCRNIVLGKYLTHQFYFNRFFNCVGLLSYTCIHWVIGCNPLTGKRIKRFDNLTHPCPLIIWPWKQMCSHTMG